MLIDQNNTNHVKKRRFGVVEPTRIFSVTRNETGVTCGPSDVMSSDVMQTASSGETLCHKPSDPMIKYLAAQFEWNLGKFGNIAVEIRIAAKMKHQCTQKTTSRILIQGRLNFMTRDRNTPLLSASVLRNAASGRGRFRVCPSRSLDLRRLDQSYQRINQVQCDAQSGK